MQKKDKYQYNIDRLFKTAEDCIDVIYTSASDDHGDPEYSSLVAACRFLVLSSWKLLLQYYSLWPDYFKGNVLLRAQRLRPSVEAAFRYYTTVRERFEDEHYHDNLDLPF